MKFLIKTLTILSFFTITLVGYGQEENTEEKINEKANKKLILDLGGDLVSSYVWRGMYQTGISIQPSLSLSAYGITIGAWGSTDFSTVAKEIDFYLSYQIKGFSIGIADYWRNGERASYFRDCGSHHIEANIGYTFPDKFPLSLEISMLLLGDEDKNDKGKNYYSTYISASFPFSVKSIDCEVGIGVTPWEGIYSDKFNVAAITLKASKNLQISTQYSISIFTELTFSPAQDKAFFVFGINF